MNGKQSKRLRRKAENLTIGQGKQATKKVYKVLKSNYLTSKRNPEK